MLDEYKHMYEQQANLLDNWRLKDKNELCNLYLEYKAAGSYLSDACVAAVICKSWNVISAYYNRQTAPIADIEDCYDWMIDGIIYTLNNHIWTDPSSNLYGDPKGPEKAIAVCIASTRITFFQYTNRGKRRINYTALSLDSLEEDSSDGYYVPYSPSYMEDYDKIYRLFKDEFENKSYFKAFALDAMINGNVFCYTDDEEYDFSFNAFYNHLKNIDDKYLMQMSKMYNEDFSNIKNVYNRYIFPMSKNAVEHQVMYMKTSFKQRDHIRSMLDDF